MKSLLALAALLFSSAAWAAERPNIVLVMADDLGWGDVAYNGNNVVATPHLDAAAAAAGLRFDHFYAAAPVCSPTRASIMTGRHPNRTGVFQWGYPIRPQESTIAEVLHAAGYATGHFGKWHLGSVRRQSPVHPGHNGFDEWLSAPNFFDNDPILSHRGQAVQLHGESSDVAAQAAIDWITAQSSAGRPFFAVVWFGSPHNPHRAAEGDRALYAGRPPRERDFYGEITGLDRAFGKLRDALARLGVREKTLLWFTSDNGGLPKLGSTGGRGHKGQIYEGGLRVPAMLEWPGKIAAPRSTDLRASSCDIYPTLVELTGAQVEHQPPLDGVSLVPLIAGDLGRRDRPLGFWEYPVAGIRTPTVPWMSELLAAQRAGGDLPPDDDSLRAAELPATPYPLDTFPGHAAWIDGDWKLHRIERPGGVTIELYDLAADPGEQHDLAADRPDRAGHLRQALETWLGGVVRSLNGEDYAGQ